MMTIEQHVQSVVEANWDDKQALIHRVTREMHLLRAALPSAADLEAIAYRMEIAGRQEVDLADGTVFDASLFLRRAAQLVRLAINEQMEAQGEAKSRSTHG
jgi:hypothetical protein